MANFSERIGLTPVKSIIQVDDIDSSLANAMWNGLTFYYWNKVTRDYIKDNENHIQVLLTRIWIHYFKSRLDEMPHSFGELNRVIKKHFFSCLWYEKYNLVEFLARNYEKDYDKTSEEFMNHCNDIFENELGGYRFIKKQLSPITAKEEIQSVEKALSIVDLYRPVKIHLGRAIELLSAKPQPDYRNSIKESISAVESFCAILTDNPKATLGQALKSISRQHPLHEALKSSFSNLYGYTSDAEGIRHALLEEDNLKQEDAVFMLVSCSAFINYLIKKTSQA